jgi:hypothetical protein
LKELVPGQVIIYLKSMKADKKLAKYFYNYFYNELYAIGDMEFSVPKKTM